MTAAVLEIDDLVVAYDDRRVLEVERLAVSPNEVLTIVGPNGAGKSTLLRVLALLEAPTRGTVRFHGAPVPHQGGRLLPLRRRMASVFQAPLLCDTTVIGNVTLGLRFRGVAAAETDRRARRWLDRFGISELAGRSARQLSGGEAQRVSLARAFALEPEVLFLDEPFSGLDAPTREALLVDLEQALRGAGVTTVFVTHDRTEALMLGDRVLVMMAGRVLQSGPPDRVFSAPATEEVARFVGADTIVAGVVRANRDGLCTVAVEGGLLEVPSDALPGEHVRVCLRPEVVVIGRVEAAPPASSMRNILVGKVRRLAPLGALVRVHVDCGFELQALITKQSLDDLRLAEGQEIRASFKGAAAHVIRRRDAPPRHGT
jgi:tungstate transport system ATP-binding protein